jgi:membrane protease YdiL (CAAX protease family)
MEKKNEQNISRWLGTVTEEKKSGLAYSASVATNILLSLLFLIVIGAAGYTNSAEYATKDWYLYCSFLLPQIAFAIVAIGYFAKTKTPVRQVAGKCSPKYFLLAVLLQVGLFSLSELNTLFLQFLARFGYESADVSLPSLNGAGVFGVLAAVALLPAIFEETIFRGILLKGLKNFGNVAAVLLCGVLFSLYHQNPAQTVYQFLCGAAFAWVALKAGSILPTVLSHFLNNAIIILLNKFGLESFSRPVQIVFIVLSVVCLILALVWLIVIDGKKKSVERVEGGKGQKPTADKKGFFLCAMAGVLVCVVMWLATLISGLA